MRNMNMAVTRPIEQYQEPRAPRFARGDPRRTRALPLGLFLHCSPSLLMFLVFSLYPMIDSILLSFQKYRLTGRGWIGFKNYRSLWHDPAFWTILKNTLYYAVGIVPIGVMLSVVISTLIYRLPSPIQIFFKSAFYLPIVTSGVVLSLIWLYLYDPAFGLLNFMLGQGRHRAGAMALQSAFQSDQSGHHVSRIPLGGAIILLTASMGGIPKDLYESARLDGASSFPPNPSITCHCSNPPSPTSRSPARSPRCRSSPKSCLMTDGGPNYATTNLVYSIYHQGFIRFDFGRASAVAVMLLDAHGRDRPRAIPSVAVRRRILERMPHERRRLRELPWRRRMTG